VSRYLLVELYEDLAAHYQTHDGACLLIKRVPGVEMVCDLGAIDQTTLATILLSGDAGLRVLLEHRRQKTSPDHVIRAYWKRVRQPKLPLERD
jgi:hypothetical protein